MAPAKWWLLSSSLAFVISAGTADSDERGPIRPVLHEGICSTIGNEYECAQAIEKVQLQGSHHVRRTEKGLCFDQPEDPKVCIADEEGLFFSYLGSFAQPNYHVLSVHFHEGSAFKLVNAKTGESTYVDDAPVPSPDGRFLAVASLDLEAHYVPNRLTIWAVEDESLRKMWSVEPTHWGPGIPTWLDDHTFELPRVEVEEHQLVAKGKIRMTHVNGKWTMKDVGGKNETSEISRVY